MTIGDAVLSTENVTWHAGGRRIVGPIQLKITPGKLTGVIGPNGSGKSTLLGLLAGIRRPSAGSVRYGGIDLAELGARERATSIALLEQHADTDLDLTARDVVELGRIPHRSRWLAGRRDDPGIVEEAMARSRITQLADRYWPTMSGGERQRTQLARALAQQPRVLLLDEPTNHLDLRHQLDFMATVRELGITSVAALHDLDLAAAFCDELVVLADGEVRAHGEVAAVLTSDRIAEIYGVRALVEHHERANRMNIVWIDVTGDRV